jgi:peptidoglycan/LPS O-acetylase OafA/YrhL
LAYECQSLDRLTKIFRSRLLTVAALVCLAVGMTLFHWPYGFALPLFGLFFVCVACGNDFGGVLTTRGALVLGECSYGIYLLHGTVLSLLFTEGAALMGRLSTPLLPVLLPPAMTAVAFLTGMTFLLIERPMIRIGKRVAKRWSSRQLRPDAVELQVAP